MKPSTKINKVKVSSEEVSKFRVTNNSSFLPSLVIDIYNNPGRAVLRELVSNAVDEHVKHNISEPIELHVPSMVNRKFSIRDYGLGLSNEDMQNLFVTIGQSTKSDTNDLIGGYGIGRLSIFTCTDVAIITSFHNGKKLTYCWNRSKDGGVELSKQSEVDSNEKSGIKIEFTANDKIDFLKEMEVLSHFKIKISCNKEIPELKKPDIEGDGWKLYLSGGWSRGNNIATMGDVPYPLEVPSDFYFLGYGYIVAKFNIGELDLVNNRDSLRYTQKTKDNINKKLIKIKDDLRKYGQEEINKCNTLDEAIKKHQSIENFMDRDSFIWKDRKYNVRNSVAGISFLVRRIYNTQDGYRLCRPQENNIFTIREQSIVKRVIIINDIKNYQLKTIRYWANEIADKPNAYIYIFDSEEDAEKVTQFDKSNFLYLSEFFKQVPKEYFKTSQPATGDKFKTGKVFKFKKDFYSGGIYPYQNIKEYLEPIKKNVNDKFLYFEMDRYISSDAVKYVKLIKHTQMPEVFLIRKGQVKDFPKAKNYKEELHKQEKAVVEHETKNRKKYVTAASPEFTIIKNLIEIGYKNKDALKLYKEYLPYQKDELFLGKKNVDNPIKDFLKGNAILNLLYLNDYDYDAETYKEIVEVLNK